MKKRIVLRSSASAVATGFMLLASVVHAAPAEPTTTVVDGASGTGFVISDSIAHSGNNPSVINSNSGQVSLKGTTAVSGDKSLSVGSDSTTTIFTNFYTKGGTGSGGGGGLGGVFFIDNGQSLTLNNVAFISNVAKGGQGGAYQKVQVASTIIPLNNLQVDVNAVQAVASGVSITQNGGDYYITGMTLPSSNELLAQGAVIAAKGNGATGTIASVSGSTVNFANGGILVDSSNLHNVAATGPLMPGQTVISFGADSTVSPVYS